MTLESTIYDLGENVQTLAANEAKTNFGQLLIQAQQSPVQISKNGKPVAVIMSSETFNAMEELKLEMLRMRVERAREQIRNGEVTDGRKIFDSLLTQLDDE